MSKILVIDDDDLTRQLIKESLLQHDHEVFEATNGDEAVAMARSTMPDLLLLDMNMPKMTGWDIAPILRSHPETKDIPVIALTADTSTEGIEKAHQAGCDYYMTKPINFGKLHDVIAKALAARSKR